MVLIATAASPNDESCSPKESVGCKSSFLYSIREALDLTAFINP